MRAATPQRLGRYLLFDEIGSGGMASVYLGKLIAPGGFSRTVALKRLHPHLAKLPEFVARLLDEARITCAIRHPNVGQTLDVVSIDDELLLVLEYVHGESLARLLRDAATHGSPMDPAIACAILAGALHGLHAAHEATTEAGEPLEIVHRDVSPQNLLVGFDGVVRVVDFGIARSLGRLMITQDGSLRGKLAYMSPEQARGQAVDRRTDVYAASVVLWEALAGRRLYATADGEVMLQNVLDGVPPPPDVHAALAETVMRGLAREPEGRFQTAQEMAHALERAQPLASTSRVAGWVREVVASSFQERSERMARVERHAPTAAQSAAPFDGTDTCSAIAIRPSPLAARDVPEVRLPRTRRWWPIALGAVLASGVMMLFTLKSLKGSGRPSSPAVVAIATAALDVPVSSLPPLASKPTQAPEQAAAPPTAFAPPRVSLPPSPLLAARKGVAPATTSTRAVAPPSCDPPYTFDDQSRRHFKRECLK